MNLESYLKEIDLSSSNLAVKQMLERRKDLGLSQRDMEKQTKIYQTNLGRIELEKTEPKLKTLEKIADALGMKIIAVPVEYLEKGEFNDDKG